MNKITYAFLVVAAVLVALGISMHAGLRIARIGSIPIAVQRNEMEVIYQPLLPSCYSFSVDEYFYPSPWQKRELNRLSLLLNTNTPPAGSDRLSLARYADYIMLHPDEASIQDGLQRDPQNALYHYLLAYSFLQNALSREYSKRDATGKEIIDYKINDRALLDSAMQEVATGLDLPLHIRRNDLLGTALNAMPPPAHLEDQLGEQLFISGYQEKNFYHISRIVAYNKFYVSLLLKERKRKKAEPFLHTGEKMMLQIVHDDKPTLKTLEMAFNLYTDFAQETAAICRQHRYEDEAITIERHYQLLTGDFTTWEESRKPSEAQSRQYLRRHGGLLANNSLPEFGIQLLPTISELQMSRKVDFTVLAEVIAWLLSLLFVGLLLYSAMKYWRWRLVLRNRNVPAHNLRIPGAFWVRILLVGIILPLALLLIYVALQVISFQRLENPIAYYAFGTAMLIIVLWMLSVPTAMVSNAIWRQSVEAGIIEVQQTGIATFLRGVSGGIAMAWASLAATAVIVLPAMFILGWVTISPLRFDQQPFWLGVLVLLGLSVFALSPAFWERHHTDCAQHFLALSRTMIPVYAVLAICTGALYPILCAQETHYLRQDKVMTTMRDGNIIAPSYAEGRLVLSLRDMVLKGEQQLQAEDSALPKNHRRASRHSTARSPR